MILLRKLMMFLLQPFRKTKLLQQEMQARLQKAENRITDLESKLELMAVEFQNRQLPQRGLRTWAQRVKWLEATDGGRNPHPKSVRPK